jgi:hypothetical protein
LAKETLMDCRKEGVEWKGKAMTVTSDSSGGAGALSFTQTSGGRGGIEDDEEGDEEDEGEKSSGDEEKPKEGERLAVDDSTPEEEAADAEGAEEDCPVPGCVV